MALARLSSSAVAPNKLRRITGHGDVNLSGKSR